MASGFFSASSQSRARKKKKKKIYSKHSLGKPSKTKSVRSQSIEERAPVRFKSSRPSSVLGNVAS